MKVPFRAALIFVDMSGRACQINKSSHGPPLPERAIDVNEAFQKTVDVDDVDMALMPMDFLVAAGSRRAFIKSSRVCPHA